MKYISVTLGFLLFSLSVMSQEQKKHIVQRGETIESIAKKYGLTVSDLQSANPQTIDFMYVGMQMMIPYPKPFEKDKNEESSSIAVADSNVILPVEKNRVEIIPITAETNNIHDKDYQHTISLPIDSDSAETYSDYEMTQSTLQNIEGIWISDIYSTEFYSGIPYYILIRYTDKILKMCKYL